MGGAELNEQEGPQDYVNLGAGAVDNMSDLGTVDFPDDLSEAPTEASALTIDTLSGSQYERLLKCQSLLDLLAESSYGYIKSAIESLGIELRQLPRIVVIGDESNGKSSVLERITMLDIFPTSSGSLTTRAPICLKLRHVAGADKRTVRVHTRRNGQPHTLDVSDEMNLRAIVEREMREVAPEGTVSSQELCVEVHSNDVPNLDLLDLPGVVAEDPIKSQTEGLVKQYISQPDTVVVCVVAATLDSLSNSRSLALVNEANKARDMLLVLTKLDNVPRGYFGRTVRRLQEETNKYRSVVGVVNRDDNNEEAEYVDLARANEEEARWFSKNLARLPAGFPLRLGENAGIHALLRALDKLTHEAIVSTWIPETKVEVEAKLAALHVQEAALGPRPESYGGCLDGPLEQFKACMAARLVPEAQTRLERFVAAARDAPVADADYKPHDMQAVRGRMERKARSLRADLRLLDEVLNLLLDVAYKALEDEVEGVDNQHHLRRFGELRAALLKVLRERRSAWEAEAKAAVTSVVDQHYARAAGKPCDEAFEGDLRAAVAEAAVTHLLIPAMGLVGDVTGLGALAAPSAEALLTECDEVASQRRCLQSRQAKHENALDVFERLKNQPYEDMLRAEAQEDGQPVLEAEAPQN